MKLQLAFLILCFSAVDCKPAAVSDVADLDISTEAEGRQSAPLALQLVRASVTIAKPATQPLILTSKAINQMTLKKPRIILRTISLQLPTGITQDKANTNDIRWTMDLESDGHWVRHSYMFGITLPDYQLRRIVQADGSHADFLYQEFVGFAGPTVILGFGPGGGSNAWL